ncbi:NAD(P)(+)--arginine ADP-ribosyltransferase (Mono(ADP-ribosyl)transferase) [Durusdinium trenchii]
MEGREQEQAELASSDPIQSDLQAQTLATSKDGNGGYGGIQRLPEGPQSCGFTWMASPILGKVKFDARMKGAHLETSEATSVTIVSQQLLTRLDRGDFVMRIAGAGGKQIPMIFGIVDGSASSSQGLKIGEPELPGSFGAACIRKSGKIVQCGNSCGPAPGVCDGDVVRLRIEEGGRVIFFKGATQISSCTVGGKGEFRVAVTLHEEGQRVEILEESVSESLARCADPRKGFRRPSKLPGLAASALHAARQ